MLLCLKLYKNILQNERFLSATSHLFSFYDIILRVDLALIGCHEAIDVFSWIYVPHSNVLLVILFKKLTGLTADRTDAAP